LLYTYGHGPVPWVLLVKAACRGVLPPLVGWLLNVPFS